MALAERLPLADRSVFADRLPLPETLPERLDVVGRFPRDVGCAVRVDADCTARRRLIALRRVDLDLHHADRTSNQLLDCAQARPLGTVAQRHRDSRSACAPGATDPVHVAFRFVRQLEVEHVAHRVDVDTARGNVGGNEYPGLTVLERFERTLPSVLRFVAVNGFGSDAVAIELLGHAIGAVLRTREHDCTRNRRRSAAAS